MVITSTKSARFKSLLPTIYNMLIVSGATHAEVSEWLNKEHDLNLKGRTFSNYLSKYGDIKTAKEGFDVEARKKSVAASWASGANSEDFSYVEKPVPDSNSNTQPVEVKPTVQATNNEAPDSSLPKEKSIRVSDQLGLTRKSKGPILPSTETLRSGFEESNEL